MSCPQQVLNKNMLKGTLEPIKDSLESSPGLWLGSEGAGAVQERGSMEEGKPGPDAKVRPKVAVVRSHPVPGIHQLEARGSWYREGNLPVAGLLCRLRTQVVCSHGFLSDVSSR